MMHRLGAARKLVFYIYQNMSITSIWDGLHLLERHGGGRAD